ncbi:zinc ribbon domain-containing protein [Halosolutus halophilus]|uniref:zinc ribbon domain-containing protein n=1 Tax=Halosolutus halophilus TaxID=1552990 RepID=UPI00223504C8|nr:zinc ribbon domain-containing protein [Halosolutus halophilus]
MAVPIALLVTFFTLALAELVAVVLGVATDAVATGDTVLEVGHAVIGFGTLLVLVSGGGFLVAGYRYCFESWFDDVEPLPVVLVPVLGLAVPIGYAIWDTGSLQLSSWLFFPIAIAANALAFRTVAIDSLREDREDRERTSFVAASLTALPAVVVLVDFAIGMLGSERPVARTLDGVVVGTSAPMARAVVIAVPLLVTVLYGAGRLYSTQSRWDGPDWSIPRLRNSLFDLVSRVRSNTSGRQLSGAGAGRVSSKSARSSDRSAASSAPSAPRSSASRSNVVVPSSPGSTPSHRDGSSSDDSDDSKPSNGRASDTSKEDERSTSATDTSKGSDRSASEDRGDASADDGSTTDGTGSDTRIFVDDFDQYGPDQTPVETCPECEEEIPSDGVYNFCPFCGGQL